MRKLPIVILGCVVVFLAVVVGVLLTRSRGPRSMTPDPAPASKADYRIKEVHLQEEGRDARWQLDAEYGEIFEDQGRTTMKKVMVQVEEPARVWTVSGDEGDMKHDTKDVELRGNVVLGLERRAAARDEPARAGRPKDAARVDRPPRDASTGAASPSCGAGLRVARQRRGDQRSRVGCGPSFDAGARPRRARSSVRGSASEPRLGRWPRSWPARWP